MLVTAESELMRWNGMWRADCVGVGRGLNEFIHELILKRLQDGVERWKVEIYIHLLFIPRTAAPIEKCNISRDSRI